MPASGTPEDTCHEQSDLMFCGPNLVPPDTRAAPGAMALRDGFSVGTVLGRSLWVLFLQS